jgi:hypothetical protein
MNEIWVFYRGSVILSKTSPPDQNNTMSLHTRSLVPLSQNIVWQPGSNENKYYLMYMKKACDEVLPYMMQCRWNFLPSMCKESNRLSKRRDNLGSDLVHGPMLYIGFLLFSAKSFYWNSQATSKRFMFSLFPLEQYLMCYDVAMVYQVEETAVEFRNFHRFI